MARPNTIGLDYYNIDTNVFFDRKIRRLLRDYKSKGWLIYSYILTEIYRDKGFYISFDSNIIFDISDSLDLEENLINDVVICCCKIGLFNQKLYEEQNILTSKSIQERWSKISKDAKRTVKCVSQINPNFSLIQEETLRPIKPKEFLPDKTEFIPEETPFIPEEIPQSKGKESKGNKINNTDVLFPKNEISDYSIIPCEILSPDITEQSNYIYGAEFERLKNQMLQEEMWVEAVCQKTGRGAFLKSILPEKIDEFFAQAITNSKMDITENLAEAKRYFSNWINTNNNASKPIPSEQPSLTMEQLRRESITYKGE